MILQEMIVTDSEGKTQTSDGKVLSGQSIQSEDMYSFYAIKQVNDPAITPAPDQMPAKVRLTMPTGGELNGLYRFPRVGEKVLVVIEGVSHYLMSYLPTAENPFSPKRASFSPAVPAGYKKPSERIPKTIFNFMAKILSAVFISEKDDKIRRVFQSITKTSPRRRIFRRRRLSVRNGRNTKRYRRAA